MHGNSLKLLCVIEKGRHAVIEQKMVEVTSNSIQ